MKVGIFSPINYPELCCTKVFPCYAKYIITSDKYLNFYRSKKGVGTIILDTAPNLPRQNNLDVLLNATNKLDPDFVVLPSRDYDCVGTVNLAKAFMRRVNISREYIGVLQGLDLDTLHKCYTVLKEYCSAIGLPSVLETVSKRSAIVKEFKITEQVVYIEIHSSPYHEVHKDKKTIIITSYPIRLAMDSRELVEYLPTPPPLDYELSKGEQLMELARDNIREYLGVVQ